MKPCHLEHPRSLYGAVRGTGRVDLTHYNGDLSKTCIIDRNVDRVSVEAQCWATNHAGHAGICIYLASQQVLMRSAFCRR